MSVKEVRIKFDGSLAEGCSGACFEVVARDEEHAFAVAKWLESKCNTEATTVSAAIYLVLEEQVVRISGRDL
jgi:hypothetical protein